MAKLGQLIKNTVNLNMRYSNALLDLSKEYVKALDGTLKNESEQSNQDLPFEHTEFDQAALS